MIYPVTMFSAKCDNCKKVWKDDEFSWVAMTDESGWHIEQVKNEDDKHYCPDCYSFDDNDKLVLTPIPTSQINNKQK